MNQPHSPEIEHALRILNNQPSSFKVLTHLDLLKPLAHNPGRPLKHVLILDTETSGMDHKSDQIIEIAGSVYPFCEQTGELFSPTLQFNQLQDLPEGVELSPIITQVTGITREDIRGHALSPDPIITAFKACDMIISHNATFDRPFVEKTCDFLGELANKPWACSLQDIDWSTLFTTPSRALAVLAAFCPENPFFYDAHRALTDCDALARVVHHVTSATQHAILPQLLAGTTENLVQVFAVGAPYEAKDLLSAHGFRWNDGTQFPNIKAWAKVIDRQSEEGCRDFIFLHEKVYGSRATSLKARINKKGDRFSILPSITERTEIVSFNLLKVYEDCVKRLAGIEAERQAVPPAPPAAPSGGFHFG